MSGRQSSRVTDLSNLLCSESTRWAKGQYLVEFIRLKTSINSLSGTVRRTFIHEGTGPGDVHGNTCRRVDEQGLTSIILLVFIARLNVYFSIL